LPHLHTQFYGTFGFFVTAATAEVFERKKIPDVPKWSEPKYTTDH